MARFFIDRPIFAWVLAIMLMGVGVLSVLILPIAQYPQIAPPTVVVSAAYPGASAQTVNNTVTQVIEEQMTGLDGLRYFNSSSTSTGATSVTLTFETGTDADIAQVQVQNKLSQATALLPEQVQRQGVTVQKSAGGFLMVVALVSENGDLNAVDLSDYLVTNLVDEFSRLEGVGNVQVFGAQYAMRIWLNPEQLAAFELTPTDVVAAVSDQNAQVSAGSFGSLPAVDGQALTATITAQSLLSTPNEFEQIVVRAETDGGLVLLRDVARVEIGAESYATAARFNGAPTSGMAIQLATGANALNTAGLVKERLEEVSAFFPDGVEYKIPYDTTPFIELSIEEVVVTLFEALVLVFLVMLLFLQNIRATLIPTLAVPVVLLGTFGVIAAFGFTINTLTMLAMVLAIGLLVDDAIVVVENVERLMEEEGLDPYEATKKSMGQITGALIGIALVLSAVFIPMAFFGGSTGVIYQQFSITIISAMALSVFVALTLTPALCATMLRKPEHDGKKRGFFGLFNTGFDKLLGGYAGSVGWLIRRPVRVAIIYLMIGGLMVFLFARTPSGFLPEEDQGVLFTIVQGPTGSTSEATDRVLAQVTDHYLNNESDLVKGIFTVSGFSFAGQGQNMGFAFVGLNDWSERTKPDQSVSAIAGRAFGAFSQIQEALVFPIVPPAVIELGNVSGFDFYLQARNGQSHEQLIEARNQLMGMAAQSDKIASVRPNGLEDATQFKLDIDWRAAGAMGLSPNEIGNMLSVAWAGRYVNDFLDGGRIKRVYVQGDAPYRMVPEDIERWRVRNSTGGLVPFSTFSTASWEYGAQGLYRYNGVPSVQLQGSPAADVTTGEGMAEMEALAANLPPGFEIAWTGLSLEEIESGDQAGLLYALSLAAVFLCLAALYESWSIPFAVMLAMPIGITGALIGAWLGGFENGVYFQVALLTVIGLTGKNAILIVEFAREQVQAGVPLYEGVAEAAKQRFRPILMTSMAFSLGVLPLVTASGAGSGGRTAIGTGVFSGTISATLLGVLFVPVFFVVIQKLIQKR